MASSEAVSKVIQDALKAIRQGREGEGLTLVNRELRTVYRDQLPLGDQVSLLDVRAALFLRQQKYDMALKEAKSMVRTDRGDGRGYLRLVSVETALGNKNSAIRYCEQGLKHVSPANPYSQSIATELARLNEEVCRDLVASKATDPLTALPLEVLSMILAHITYIEHVRLLRVCKSWNRILLQLPPLTEVLSFESDPSRVITPKMLRAGLRRLKSPTRVVAHSLKRDAGEILADALCHWPNFPHLRHLEVGDTVFQARNLPLAKYDLRKLKITSQRVELRHVARVLKECHRLESATFSTIGNPKSGDRTPTLLQSDALRQLDLSFGVYVRFPNVTAFLSGLPALTSLRFDKMTADGVGHIHDQDLDLRNHGALDQLDLTNCQLGQLLLPPQIRTLIVKNTKFLRPRAAHAPLLLTHLETLVANCNAMPPFLTEVLAGMNDPRLKRLALPQDWLPELVPDSQPPSAVWMKEIRHLTLFTDWTSPKYIRALLSACCPELRSLVVHNDRHVTSLLVSDLIKEHTTKLKTVAFHNCPHVSSDIIPWAAAHGVAVSITKPPESGGRRL